MIFIIENNKSHKEIYLNYQTIQNLIHQLLLIKNH